jgi:hypothetical protein
MSGGNVAPEIASYKGQIEAVQQAMIRSHAPALARGLLAVAIQLRAEPPRL